MTRAWYERLRQEIRRSGGMFNAHLHLDRAGTFDDRYLAGNGHRTAEDFHISLKRKHSMIADIHAGPAFERDDYFARVEDALAEMVAVDTQRADTMVDVTPNRVGLTGLGWMKEIQTRWADRIDLRLGAYTPFGFVDAEPERWEIFAEGARQADFIGSLPEADDTDDYPTHIGFMEHCRRVLELAQDLGKMVHVHTDQRFEASECGTERLVEAVRRYGAPRSESGEPLVWAVHMVSPSTYDEARFLRLAADMAEMNIGVIACPSAALGMRMLRPLQAPTGNCMPRVLELVSRGVAIRIGSDNIADICSPSTTANLIDEGFVLSAALRFYQPEIIARLLCGQRPDAAERAFVSEHLDKNTHEIERMLSKAHARVLDVEQH
ncbi:hypothetical protein EV667_1255 [Ancylobacter aquaticus]|uniref:Cytosine deaminase n=1 Tax=Ancylobacter aquaticus TaxID=100 RepID=A0A4R1IBR1_ANCAQ|nr:hypothetical protein [Ancylobacter aquaticus]TCK31150.1 hypothetical protein EV667_1255 [Ancylobacter aquaticus]